MLLPAQRGLTILLGSDTKQSEPQQLASPVHARGPVVAPRRFQDLLARPAQTHVAFVLGLLPPRGRLGRKHERFGGMRDGHVGLLFLGLFFEWLRGELQMAGEVPQALRVPQAEQTLSRCRFSTDPRCDLPSFSQAALGSRPLRALRLNGLNLMVLSSGYWYQFLKLEESSMLCRSRPGCLRISSVLGLSFGRNFSIELTRSDRSEEQLLEIGLKTPAFTFLQRLCRSVALKGGSRAQSSQMTHPSDQISLFISQGRSCQTSGLAQQGVPVWVCARPFLSTFETFRSPSLQVPSELMKMLAALRSRWRIFLSCRDLSPRVMSWTAFQISASLILVLALRFWLMTRMRSPPEANSMTMQRQPLRLSQKASLNFIMQSSVSDARILISLRAFSFYFYFMPVMRTFFRAQTQLSWRRRTWQTCPNAPSPTFFRIQKSFNVPYSLYIYYNPKARSTALRWKE